MFTRNSIVLSSNIKTPLTAISRAIGNILQLTYGQLVKQLFSNQEQGFAYDPNDLTTLYQDAAGTIPVTAAGQPVGLMLDKSKGLTLGSTIITNGNFESDTAWNKGAGWSISNGKARFDGTGSYSNLGGVVTTSINGKFFKVEFELSDVGTSVTQVRILTSGGLAATVPVTGAGKYSAFVVGSAVNSVGIQSQAATGANYAFSLDNVSLKELAGNHAYQTVSASRPILQQTPILGTTEYVQNGKFDSDISGWGVIGSSTTKTVAWESGALKVSASTTGTCVSSGTLSTLLVIGKTYEVSCECLAHDATGGLSGVFIGDGAQTVGNVMGTGKFKFLVTATLNTSKINFGRVGSGVASEVFSKWDNISIKEVTGYRTDQNYLKFDGVDDFLQTNNIDFTATDKVSLFAGVRKYVNSARILCELSSDMNVNPNSFYITAPENGTGAYGFKSRGSAGSNSAMTVLTQTASLEDSCVLSASGDISADRNTIRRNGLLSAISYDLGTGNYGNYPLYIGRRGGTSLPFNGHLYSLIGIGRLTTDSETIALEKSIAKNTGVTLNV